MNKFKCWLGYHKPLPRSQWKTNPFGAVIADTGKLVYSRRVICFRCLEEWIEQKEE